jgi:tetratricopeptide (TPR) repeat protein
MSCSLTLIAGLVFNYVAFEAITHIAASQSTAASGVGAGLLAIIAFSLGYFPSLAIRWFNELAYSALGMHPRRANDLPLGLIDGISQWHETRLHDNGIDNVQNLASTEIPDLLLNTTFNAQEVIDWVDQAILYLYLDQSTIESFRRTGIRRFYDFLKQWEPYYCDPKSSLTPKFDSQKKVRIALQLQSTSEKIDILYQSIMNAPNSCYVGNYWENVGKLTERTREYGLENVIKWKLQLWKNMEYEVNRESGGNASEILQGEIRSLFREYENTHGNALVPHSADDWYNLAIWYRESEDYNKSIEAFKTAIAINPDCAIVYNDLAWLYVDKIKEEKYYP